MGASKIRACPRSRRPPDVWSAICSAWGFDNTARTMCDTPDMFGNVADIPEEVLFWYPFLRPLAAWWNPL